MGYMNMRITELTVQLDDGKKIKFHYDVVSDTLTANVENMLTIPTDKYDKAEKLATSILKPNY